MTKLDKCNINQRVLICKCLTLHKPLKPRNFTFKKREQTLHETTIKLQWCAKILKL